MTLHALLALYYLCDQAAAVQPLPRQQVAECMATYEQVKLSFVDHPHAPPGSPGRIVQNRSGYAAFKAWEQANPDHVARLKSQAQSRLTP